MYQLQPHNTLGKRLRYVVAACLVFCSVTSTADSDKKSRGYWVASKGTNTILLLPEDHFQAVDETSISARLREYVHSVNIVFLEMLRLRDSEGRPYDSVKVLDGVKLSSRIGEREADQYFNRLGSLRVGRAAISAVGRAGLESLNPYFLGELLFGAVAAENSSESSQKIEVRRSLSSVTASIARKDTLRPLDTSKSLASVWQPCADATTTRRYLTAAGEDAERNRVENFYDRRVVLSLLEEGRLGQLDEYFAQARKYEFIELQLNCAIEPRTAQWVDTIVAGLTHFEAVAVVFGAAHAFGPRGLLALLEDAGFAIRAGE